VQDRLLSRGAEGRYAFRDHGRARNRAGYIRPLTARRLPLTDCALSAHPRSANNTCMPSEAVLATRHKCSLSKKAI
jgi:hypothetical protein